MSTAASTANYTTSHLWVCAYPFIESALFIVPLNPTLPTAPEAVRAELYDADGNLANELNLSFPRGQVGVIELESIMGECKLEGGFRHAHLVIHTPAGVSHYVRMHTREGAAFIGDPAALASERSSFFPMTMDDGRSYYIAMVNQSKNPATLKCRLFCAKRSPETVFTVPPLGSRIVSLENEFPEFATIEGGKQLQAYVRLSTKSETTVGVQLIERVEGKSEGGYFYSVS